MRAEEVGALREMEQALGNISEIQEAQNTDYQSALSRPGAAATRGGIKVPSLNLDKIKI